MKYTYAAIAVVALLVIGFYMFSNNQDTSSQSQSSAGDLPVQITPIEHATFVMQWGGTVVYADPVGDASAFAGQPKPDIVLVTDIHGDHMSAETLSAVLGDAMLVAPQAVKDQLPEELATKTQVIKNGETKDFAGITVTATPMYNIPESADAYHPEGRGNGYQLEKDGFRVYIAGDTSATPEMKALKNIDYAFIPMNLPYTMDVSEAAEGVLAFAPKHVTAYHYRGQGGLSDVERFKALVNAGNPDIDVQLLNWY